jgi:hypothetical protein
MTFCAQVIQGHYFTQHGIYEYQKTQFSMQIPKKKTDFGDKMHIKKLLKKKDFPIYTRGPSVDTKIFFLE